MPNTMRGESGASLIEYVLLIGMITILLIVAVTTLGRKSTTDTDTQLAKTGHVSDVGSYPDTNDNKGGVAVYHDSRGRFCARPYSGHDDSARFIGHPTCYSVG